MTQTTLTRIILALLMLLLVAVSAIFFVFQTRQTLETRLSNAQEQNDELVINFSQSQQELVITQATRDASVASLATAESDTIALEGQLNVSQEELEQLQNSYAEQETVLSTTRSELTDLQLAQQELTEAPPLLRFLEPTTAVFTPTSRIPISLVASDNTHQVSQINPQVNGTPYTATQQEPSNIMLLERVWNPVETGVYVLSATAVNSNNISSQAATVTITTEDKRTSQQIIDGLR